MSMFEPTARQANLLILLGCASLGYAFYLRSSIIESQEIATACAAGLPRAVCSLRQFVIELANLEIFGGIAMVAAVVHFVRPALVPFTIALVAAVLGLVLGNTGMSAFAVGILIMAFARSARASTPGISPATPRRTTEPANSRMSH